MRDSAETGPRLQAVDPLYMEISGSKIVISSPLAAKRLRVGRKVADLLLSARDGLSDLPDLPAVPTLIEAGFLVKAGPANPVPPPWDAWGPGAWSFHQSIRDIHFISNDPVEVAGYREKFAGTPRPHSVRATDGPVLLLPRVRAQLDASFRSVLEGRRTHRHFVAHTLSLDVFSDLLHYTFAPLRFVDAGEMGVMQLRAAASGGARHETEAFVFVFSVDGVEPGLYHYDNIRHGLVLVSRSAGRAELEHLTFEQGFFNDSCFGVLTVAVADRLSWKYQHPMAYKMLQHDVGHMAQVFSMAAAAFGLGASLTGAIRNTEADQLLQLDQPREFTTFALACGLPVRTPSGLPTSIRTPREAPDYY